MKALCAKSVRPIALNCSAALATDGIACTSGRRLHRLQRRHLARGRPVGAVLQQVLDHGVGLLPALFIHAGRNREDVRVELDGLLAIRSQRVDEVGLVSAATSGLSRMKPPVQVPSHMKAMPLFLYRSPPTACRARPAADIVLVHHVMPVLDGCDGLGAVQRGLRAVLADDAAAELPHRGGDGVARPGPIDRPHIDVVLVEACFVRVLAVDVRGDLLRPLDELGAILGQVVGVEPGILDHLRVVPQQPAVIVEGHGHRLAVDRDLVDEHLVELILAEAAGRRRSRPWAASGPRPPSG